MLGLHARAGVLGAQLHKRFLQNVKHPQVADDQCKRRRQMLALQFQIDPKQRPDLRKLLEQALVERSRQRLHAARQQLIICGDSPKRSFCHRGSLRSFNRS